MYTHPEEADSGKWKSLEAENVRLNNVTYWTEILK